MFDKNKLKTVYDRWFEVLEDERRNVAEAIPIVEADMRLDCYYAPDVSFSHLADIMREKTKILDYEINEYLPSLWKQVNLSKPRQ